MIKPANTVDLSSYVPLYRQIEEILKEEIKKGVLRPHSKVWSERIISETFSVSRLTARKAIGNLVQEGYLFTTKGKGTFVSDLKISLPVVKLKNFFDEMQEIGRTPQSVVLGYEEFEADPRMAGELDVAEGTPLFRIKRVMSADDVPYSVETKCIVAQKCKVLTEVSDREDEVLDFISGRCHQCVTKFDVFVEATVVCESEAALLGLKPGSPALCIRKYAYDAGREKISYIKSIYRGDLYRLHSVAEY
jgi:GntR family transcriptional regulator